MSDTTTGKPISPGDKPKYRPYPPQAGLGRPKGTKNKATILREQMAIRSLSDEWVRRGLMPLQIMLAYIREEPLPDGKMVSAKRFAAAVDCAPYMHPKLTAVAVKTEPPPLNFDFSGFQPEELRQLLEFVRRAQRDKAGQVPQIEGMVSKDDEK